MNDHSNSSKGEPDHEPLIKILKGPDLGLLIKMLRMTTSDTDTIALVAMRKANKELEKFGGDWEALLLGKVKVTIVSDPFANNSIPNVSNGERARRTSTPPNTYTPSPPPPPPPPQRDAFQDLADAKVRQAQAEIERRRRVEQVQREAAERQRLDAERAERNRRERQRQYEEAQRAQAFGTGKKNKFAGHCRYCKRHLPAGDGDLVQVNGAWSVQCPPSLGCQPKPAPFKSGKKPTMDDLKNLI